MNKKRIAFLGDSLTWRNNWAAALPNFEAYNFGIDGDTVKGVSARLDSVIAAKPDTVFLQIGINDMTSDFSWLGNHASQSRANLYVLLRTHTGIWEKLHTALPDMKLYVCSLLPTATSFDPQDVLNSDVRSLNTMLEKTAASTPYTGWNIAFINLYEAMCDEKKALREAFSEDGVHLLNAGYDAWFEMLEPFVYR